MRLATRQIMVASTSPGFPASRIVGFPGFFHAHAEVVTGSAEGPAA